MPVVTHQLGPGQLTFGTAGTAKEFGAAVKSCRLTPEASDGETISVLSGDEFVDAGAETWTLEGTIFQSYDAQSLLLWANTNSGNTMPFTFIPATGQKVKAAGNVLIRSLSVGGDVKTRNTSDFKFKATSVVLSAMA